jgi:DNA-binding MarR family transcriptional regulator
MNRSPFQRILCRTDLKPVDKLIFYFLYYRKPDSPLATQLEILRSTGAGSISSVKRSIDRMEKLKIITIKKSVDGRIHDYKINDVK